MIGLLIVSVIVGVFGIMWTLCRAASRSDDLISRESSFTLVDGQPKFEVNGHDLIVNLWNNRKE